MPRGGLCTAGFNPNIRNTFVFRATTSITTAAASVEPFADIAPTKPAFGRKCGLENNVS